MLARTPPSGVLRALLRAPEWLYRLHLGVLLGRRFLRLTHRGRRSGQVYRTVLEVVRYDPATHESVVVSAWGDRADWYRNIRAHPALLVETGGQRYAPRQRFLSDDELSVVFAAYARTHRLAARLISPLFGLRLDGSPTARQALARQFGGVAFQPAAGRAVS